MKKRIRQLPVVLLMILALLSSGSCTRKGSNGKEQQAFTFAFMTDIHLERGKNAVEGFNKAIDEVNKLAPDFVITGGDLIADALGQTYGLADSLYNLYQEVVTGINAPVYNTMGNHEIYGIYKEANADPDHPEYGEKMFEKRLGPSYYSFEHKGWKFMIINSIEDTKQSSYIGLVDDKQIEWIKEELGETDPETPIVLSTHIPFIMAFTQYFRGSTVPNDPWMVVNNSKDVLDLFKGHNLKLVLQGHQHNLECIYIDGIHFINGGAVSAAWWTGPYYGNEEGFILVRVNGDEFDWEYIDYGWEAE